MGRDLSSWTARPRPGLVALDGRYARLEPLDWGQHGAALYAAIAGPDNRPLWRYLQGGFYEDIESFRASFARAADGSEKQPMVICARAADGGIGPVLGMASFMRIREVHGSAEVGAVVFSEVLKRTRTASEAIYLMAAHVFDALGYRRFEWKCNSQNDASRQAALRFGFQFEGVFRNDMVLRGENRDTAWFAMTDGDWPAVKARFEAWLNPANFDADGRQQVPLSAC